VTSFGGNLTDYLFVFTDGSDDANWQGASKGFVGDVSVNGIIADERTSGNVPYAGTIYTNDNTLSAWQNIVNNNPGQASSSLNETTRLAGLITELENAFTLINSLIVTPGYASVSAVSLNGLNTQNGNAETFVINVTSGFSVSSKINITGDANDLFILRWDDDANFSNGYDGQVKFKSGGAIVPLGGLKASNFYHVAGDINASGGGSNPALPYPQGPRTNNGTGPLINGASNFSGGGFFTGYWFTTGTPDIFGSGQPYGKTSSLSNAIFVGGWYSKTNKFSMTSGTSGVHVGCETSSPKMAQAAEATAPSSFDAMAYPNPSIGGFTVSVETERPELITVRIMDMKGQLLQSTTMNPANGVFKVGEQLPAGTYLAEVTQGTNRKILKLIKL
jgi:hypothetical protein